MKSTRKCRRFTRPSVCRFDIVVPSVKRESVAVSPSICYNLASSPEVQSQICHFSINCLAFLTSNDEMLSKEFHRLDYQNPRRIKKLVFALLVLHAPHQAHAHGPMPNESSCSSVWAILPLREGRTVACSRRIQASSALRRLPYLCDMTWSGIVAIYVYRGRGSAGERYAMILKEMNRLKCNCSATSSINALLIES